MAAMPDATMVRRLFARVADRYDRANHLLSFGVDHAWRRRVLRFADVQPGEEVLDACSGTGDLALTIARAGAQVVGSDFCPEMLRHALRKSARARQPAAGFVAADTLRLPFADGRFDLATVAFGIRNVQDPVAGLRELARVVRPGGRVVVLEFSRPRVPLLRGAYLFYFGRVLPRIGSWVTGDREGSYRYLHDSVMAFPERDAFLALMTEAGLQAPRSQLLSCGIASLYRAEKALR